MSKRAWRRLDAGEKDVTIESIESILTPHGEGGVYDGLSRAIVAELAPAVGWPEERRSIALSPAEFEMARDAGTQGFVKDGIRVVVR